MYLHLLFLYCIHILSKNKKILTIFPTTKVFGLMSVRITKIQIVKDLLYLQTFIITLSELL